MSYPELKASCVICGTVRDLVAEDTWFFVGGPMACVHLCSRGCLLEYSKALQPKLKSVLCPECGKIVSFSEGELEVCCGRCETTIPTAAAPAVTRAAERRS